MGDLVSTLAPKPSWAEQFVAKAKHGLAASPPVSVGGYVRAIGSTAVEYAEGGAVGALLGAAHAKWGLDTALGPVDAWLAVLAALASVALTGVPGMSPHARTIGASSITCFGFRRLHELVHGGGGPAPVRRIGAPAVHGEDPIIRVARVLG